MPTVPMFIQHPQPTDASHGVFAPGGYEWWHFDAEDEKGEVIVAIDFHKGCPAHAEYRKRFRRYRRHPTRFSPPLPDEYPCVSVALFEREVRTAGSHRELRAGELVASGTALHLTATSTGIVHDARPSAGIHVSVFDPASLVKVELDFQPVLTPQSWQGELSTDPNVTGSHRWVLSDPLCRVTGEVLVGRDRRAVKLEGLGYHEYSYGTGPMAGDTRGRVLAGDGFIAFRGRGGVVEGTRLGIVQHRTAPRSGTLTFETSDGGELLRTHDLRALGSSPHGTHVIGPATRAGKSRRAFGELTSGGTDHCSVIAKRR